MKLSENVLRSLIPTGGHPETAARMSGGLVSLYEMQQQGIDISDLVENSGVPGTGVETPNDDYTHVGVRMPKAAKEKTDVRPQYAYNSDGTMIGFVQARLIPVAADSETRYGTVPEYDATYVGQKTYPHGLKKEFENEKEAKAYVASDETVKWMQPEDGHTWESMTDKQRVSGAYKLAEDIIRGNVQDGKFAKFLENLVVREATKEDEKKAGKKKSKSCRS